MQEFVCQVRRAGVTTDGHALLDLKDEGGSFDWTWFQSKPEISREVIATALVAVSTDKRLFLGIDEPIQSWASVTHCAVVK